MLWLKTKTETQKLRRKKTKSKSEMSIWSLSFWDCVCWRKSIGTTKKSVDDEKPAEMPAAKDLVSEPVTPPKPIVVFEKSEEPRPPESSPPWKCSVWHPSQPSQAPRPPESSPPRQCSVWHPSQPSQEPRPPESSPGWQCSVWHPSQPSQEPRPPDSSPPWQCSVWHPSQPSQETRSYLPDLRLDDEDYYSLSEEDISQSV